MMSDMDVNYNLLAVFDIDDSSYAAVLNNENNSDKLNSINFYGCNEGINGELNLIEIKDDDEYKKVSRLFIEVVEEQYR